eukprot:Skav233076  [mRNA]  locus=scaffold1468:276648:276872:- [translate_table: standard]
MEDPATPRVPRGPMLPRDPQRGSRCGTRLPGAEEAHEDVPTEDDEDDEDFAMVEFDQLVAEQPRSQQWQLGSWG